MSALPPCSGRPGIVRAPSLPTFSRRAASEAPAWQFFGSGGLATSLSASLEAAMSSPSRLFHVARISVEGAQPTMPGLGCFQLSVTFSKATVSQADTQNKGQLKA